MSLESSSPTFLCKILHSLVTVTLNNVIVPLRKELRRNKHASEILTIEIQDAENKTYEYLARLISVVCNATEEVANVILKEYPKSEICFKCLGVNDDTAQGLIRLRGIGFLQLLDMTDEEVNNILLAYNDSADDIEHVLAGLAKIRGNIDLIESSMTFDDDTRNLMKLVIRLTEDSGSEYSMPESVAQSTCTKDQLSLPDGFECSGKSRVSDTFYRSHVISTADISNVHCLTPQSSTKVSASSLRVPPFAKENLGPSVRRYSHTKHYGGSHSIGHTALLTHFPWEIDPRLLNGGSSVPSTPVWNGKSAQSISPGASMRNERWCMTPEDLIPVHPHGKQPGTPPSKHRLRLPFPLHRSSSHESNLTNRLSPHLTPFQESGAISPGTHHRSSSTVRSVPAKSVPPDVCYPDGTLSRQENYSVTSYNYGSVGHIPSDIRHARAGLQPTNSGMTFDFDFPFAPSIPNNLGSTAGVTSILSRNGVMHKFERESKLGNLVKGTLCAVCSNRMIFRLQHCINCKIKVHRSCLPQTRELRCIPPEQSTEGFDSKGSPNISQKVQVNSLSAANQTSLRTTYSTPAFQGSESTSISSCTSSAPGSPFGVAAPVSSGHQLSHMAVESLPSVPRSLHSPSYTTVTPNLPNANGSRLASPCAIPSSGNLAPSPHHAGYTCNRFDFPSVSHSQKELIQVPSVTPQDISSTGHLVGTQSSADSEHTVVDSLMRRFDSVESQDDGSNLMRANSISVTLKEWDIPMENLIIRDVIGQGTFGTVHRAKWHGEVAVKFIDIDPEDEDGSVRLEAFKREVALLHKTRHENLVLFMGACMKPPDLAIVTQLSQGETLYQQLHQRDTGIPVNRTINIALQIAKGMGYLHAKGIVHRDLKTRNIFVEPNSRVVIGDFGVFNCVQLYKKAKWGNYLSIPPFWLCYVAPEIVRAMKSSFNSMSGANELPFSSSSDVFAFGTVWYELLTNEFPYKGSPAEAVIYMCGRGIKSNVRILGPKDFKEILAQCWSYSPHNRPEFTTLVKMLDRLPKLHRSPSYPVKPTPGFSSGSHDPLFV